MPALPVIGAVAAVAGAGAAVVGTVSSISAQKKALAAQNSQYAYEKQINTNRSVRERRDAIRSARIAGANVVQGAANTGGSDTSAALGTMGSIASQIDSNLSFLDTQTSLANKAGAESQVAQTAKANAATWGQVSDLGMAIFNTAEKHVKL